MQAKHETPGASSKGKHGTQRYPTMLPCFRMMNPRCRCWRDVCPGAMLAVVLDTKMLLLACSLCLK
eukprot:1137659-Pelagomonas_calceolata.AAC.2